MFQYETATLLPSWLHCILLFLGWFIFYAERKSSNGDWTQDFAEGKYILVLVTFRTITIFSMCFNFMDRYFYISSLDIVVVFNSETLTYFVRTFSLSGTQFLPLVDKDSAANLTWPNFTLVSHSPQTRFNYYIYNYSIITLIQLLYVFTCLKFPEDINQVDH